MNNELLGIKKTISSGEKVYRKEILLNQDNISGICPYCNSNVSFTWVNPVNESYELKNNKGITFDKNNFSWAMCFCPECEKCVLVKMEYDGYLGEETIQRYSPEILPSPFPNKSSEEIPEDIRKDFDEAKRCFSVDCYNAAAVMLRRSLEKMLVDQGSNKDSIFEQIKELIESGILTKNLESAATNLRILGKYGAHNKTIEIAKEDVIQGFLLADHLFNFFYITPVNCKNIENKFQRKA